MGTRTDKFPELSPATKNKWEAYLANAKNLGHADRARNLASADSYLIECLTSGRNTIERVSRYMDLTKELSVVELGCSSGINCLAMYERNPSLTVHGIEPEPEAVEFASEVGRDYTRQIPAGGSLRFSIGVGEDIQLPANSVDFILCHTVLEHVQSVPKVIQEFARILKPGGKASIEAPNYWWPREPHLEIWCVPMLGKSSVKLAASLQRYAGNLDFVDHLQFVTTSYLEQLFSSEGFSWINRAEEKVKQLLNGVDVQVLGYPRIARLLPKMKLLGVEQLAYKFACRMSVYPSMMYTITKE